MARYALWEQAGSYASGVDRRLIAALWPVGACSGCAVTAVAGAMQVNVAPGAVAVPSQNGTGSTLCVSDAVETVTLPSGIVPAAGQSVYVWVTCHPRATDLDGGQNNDFIFDYVAGTAAASPVLPAVPAGQTAIAALLIPGGSTVAITAAMITDRRPVGLAVPRSAHARYHFTGGTFGTSLAVVAAQAVDDDPQGLYNPATGLFTCPVAGFYQCQALLNGSPLNAGQWLQAQFARNGSGVSPPQFATAPTASSGAPLYGGFPVRCAAGDTLAVMAAAQVAGVAVTPTQNFVSFDLIGTA